MKADNDHCITCSQEATPGPKQLQQKSKGKNERGDTSLCCPMQSSTSQKTDELTTKTVLLANGSWLSSLYNHVTQILTEIEEVNPFLALFVTLMQRIQQNYFSLLLNTLGT